MKLWAISMVRDELDILPYTIEHLLNEGVDHILIADNRSVDGTRAWLERAARWAPITVLDDPDIAYYQSRKITALYRVATSGGAEWIIPFDADEIWYAEDGRRLVDVIADNDDVDCLQARVYNYHPTRWDNEYEFNVCRRLVYRNPDSNMVKVAVRAGIDALVIEQGNHDVMASRSVVTRSADLVVGHFPWRTFGQFVSKVRNGSQAYAAAKHVSADQGEHWRFFGRVLEDSGVSGLRLYWHRWYYTPDIPLVYEPVPWRGL